MNVLVVNCGSSSLKYQLYDMHDERQLVRGLVERIGRPGARVTHRAGDREYVAEQAVADHDVAFELLRSLVLDAKVGAVSAPDEVSAIGHRVAHGGDELVEPTLVDDRVIATITKFSALAPLHNPANLAGMRAAGRFFPHSPNVAVFDTAFHKDIPPHAFHVALPYELYERMGIRRYGFHGMSHRFVAERAARILDMPLAGMNAIICHLGSGCSMAAIRAGKSVDTTLGLTPLTGLVMGTRPGDLDPGILLHLLREKAVTFEQLDDMLHRRSGLLGLSGVSNDMREIREAVAAGNPRARLAVDVFCYRIRKYIGAFLAVLGRADALVFTGGIGENDDRVRAQATEGLEGLGIACDPLLNVQANGREAGFGAADSAVRLLVVPTNEELLIARDAYEVVRSSRH